MNHLELLKKYMKYCDPQLNAAEVVRESPTEFSEQERELLMQLQDELDKEWLND